MRGPPPAPLESQARVPPEVTTTATVLLSHDTQGTETQAQGDPAGPSHSLGEPHCAPGLAPLVLTVYVLRSGECRVREEQEAKAKVSILDLGTIAS